MNVTPFPQARGWHFEWNRAPWLAPVLYPRHWIAVWTGEINPWFGGELPGARWFTVNVRGWGWPFVSYKGPKRSFYLGWKPYGIGGVYHDVYDAWLPQEFLPQSKYRAADGTHGLRAVVLTASVRSIRR